MKKLFTPINLSLILFAVLFTFCSSPIESDTVNSSEIDLEKQLENMAVEELSPEEIDGLVFMREEEKLARDVYLTLDQQWEQKAFSNIAKSEQKHMDAIKVLLDRYELDDPIINDEIGSFTNSDLQKLFDNLTVQGTESLVSGLKVGATIEEIDILDLEEQINIITDNEDLKLVYNNLLRGSMNHLRAFVRNIESQGETYVPQFLNEDAYQIIINSEMEKSGSGRGKGNKNRGKNKCQ